jgi:8-oxo-dGTP pyrophosphatase MutT (NUDIX family)
MIPSSIDPGLFKNKTEFPDTVIERLGKHPCNFQETFHLIKVSGDKDSRHRAAGVLLPLLFRKSSPEGEGEFYFQLIKRSCSVPQPGDLSLPGGMIHPVDHLLRRSLIHGPFSMLRGKALTYTLEQPSPSFRLITLFMCTALRESWEEIRLSPIHVRFLGPLPTYSLTLFRRTIFPLAGFVENAGPSYPNREVEKIVEIPLSHFFRKDLYGCYQIAPPYPAERTYFEHPCLIFQDDGKEEILWGATFHIIIGFLRIVTGFNLPDWRSGRVVLRNLRPDYLTGRTHS